MTEEKRAALHSPDVSMTQRSISEDSTLSSNLLNGNSPSGNLVTNLSSLDRQSLPAPRGETVPPDRIISNDKNNADSVVRNRRSFASAFSSSHSLLTLKTEGGGGGGGGGDDDDNEMDINIPRHRSRRGVKDMNSEKQTDKVNQEHQHNGENLQRFFKVIASRDVNASPSFTQCVQGESMGLERRISDDISAPPVFASQSPLPLNVLPPTPTVAASASASASASVAAPSSNAPLPSIMVPSGGMDLTSSGPAGDMVYTPISRYTGTRGAASLTPAENREEVEVPNMAFTLFDYAMQRPKPYIPVRSVKVKLVAFLGVVAMLPFLFVVFLFGMHYWATDRLITALGDDPIMVSVSEGTCGDDFYKLTQGKVGSMPKEAFTLMIGILLAFIILVIGGIFFLCVVHWRYVFSPYLQILNFIRTAAPELSKIEALTPEQLEKAPKPLSSLYFWRNEKKESVITQLADKVVTLGNSLQELKRYVPYNERNVFDNVIVNAQNREGAVSVHISDRHSESRSRRLRDLLSVPASPRDDAISVNFSPINPLTIDNTHHNNSTNNIALPNLRRENLIINAGSPEVEALNTNIEPRIITVEDLESSSSPSRRRVMFSSRHISPNFAGSVNSGMMEIPESGRSLRISTSKEQTFSECGETKSMMATDFGYSIQQVTFLVCRLFLPKINLQSNDKVKNKTAAEIQEMSRRFLKVVLRVSKEENGVPFDVRLDSVIITFHTPSGPNSVNLVHPSSCAFRIVSELAMLELHWSNISSTPFIWGVAMHLSRFVIGLCTTGTRNITVLYSEEVKIAYRVAELCHVFNTPFLMFQSCYNVFRLCVIAVPVDVIRRDTPNGKVCSYLYSPKAFGDEEEVNKKRQRYTPIMEAFGLMCERNFTEASKKLEGLLDLDNSVSRLQRLCDYFAHLDKEGKLDTLFPHDVRYSREEPKWSAVEFHAKEFFQTYNVEQQQQQQQQQEQEQEQQIDQNEGSHNSTHTNPYIDRNNISFTRSEVTDETRSAITPVRSGATDAITVPQGDNLILPVFSITMPPSFATQSSGYMHDSELPTQTFVQGGLSLSGENMDMREINNRNFRRELHASALCSDGEIESEGSFRHGTDINDEMFGSRDGEDEEEKRDNNSGSGALDFDLYEPIGKGTFGTIYRGILRDGTFVAVKKLNVPDKDKENPWIQSSRSEVEMLSGLHHENIVRYIGSAFKYGSLCIITELVPGGSLAKLVHTFHTLPLDTIRIYTGNILLGLQYLHERQIVHRDISPNNVLVNIDGVCKLSDFGGAVECAMQSTALGCDLPINSPDTSSITGQKTMMVPGTDVGLSSTGTILHKDCFGTPACMSPEACSGIVDPKNDIWSLGITLYFCFTGHYPWPESEMKDPISLIKKIRSELLTPDIVSDSMDAQAVEFIKLCLKRNASERPTATELMFHAFMVD